jgi:phosphoglucosamine mutase
LGEARKIMTVLPQVLKSARIPNEKKEAAMADPEILTLCADAERRLAGRGRVLVRASGTEPIVRVMLEGEEGRYTSHIDRFIIETGISGI